jgi:hypothetical protein
MAERNQKLINNNNQDYARIDKSKGEDSVVKIATTGIKITNKIRKIKGKLTNHGLCVAQLNHNATHQFCC